MQKEEIELVYSIAREVAKKEIAEAIGSLKEEIKATPKSVSEAKPSFGKKEVKEK